jgi:hypothetical protein
LKTTKKKVLKPHKARTPSQIARGSKRKGATGERRGAEELQPIWPGAKRGIGQMRASNEVPDIDGTPIWWEVKNTLRAYDVWKALVQAEKAAAGRRASMVLARKTGHPWLVCLRIEHFRALMRLLHDSCLDRDAELARCLSPLTDGKSG